MNLPEKITSGIKFFFLVVAAVFLDNSAIAQKGISEGDKLVFVYFENREHNFLAIPNMAKFHHFKIFRKQKADSTYQLVAEKKKPLLPLRENLTPFGVTWEDKACHSREVDYKVLAFDKKENELCEMIVIWHNASSTSP